MLRTPCSIGVLIVSGCLSLASIEGQQKPEKTQAVKPVAAIEISKETTFVTEPRDGQGGIDYAQAVNQFFSRGVTPENNSVVLLYQALGPSPEGVPMPERFFQWLGVPRPPEVGDYTKNIRKALPDVDDAKLADVSLQMDRAMSRPWNRDDFPYIAQWIEANQVPLAVVHEAVQRPKYFSPWVVEPQEDGSGGGLIAVLLPGVQQSREIARQLSCRALWRLDQGDLAGAWQDIFDTHRLGRLVGQGPSLIEGLVGIAIENIGARTQRVFLENAKLTPEQIRGYWDEFAMLPPPTKLSQRIDYGERLMFLDTVQMISRGDPAMMGLMAEDHSSLLKILSSMSVDWNVVMRMGNQWFDRSLAAIKIDDYRQRNDELRKLELAMEDWEFNRGTENPYLWALGVAFSGRKVLSESMGQILVSLMFPAFRQVQNAEDRTNQNDRNLQVAMALTLFRADNNGRYPETLEQLVPLYIDELPNDLFVDQPLHYRREGGGFVLYSVGRDGKDDGGIDLGQAGSGDDLVVKFEK